VGGADRGESSLQPGAGVGGIPTWNGRDYCGRLEQTPGICIAFVDSGPHILLVAATARRCTACETPLPDDALYCPRCGQVTPTEISGESGTVRRPLVQPADEFEQRQRLKRALGDGFEVGALLGRGGFAEVFAATDKRLRRQVAIKIVRSDLVLSPNLVARFLREAQSAAQLSHPNIIPIFQVGEAEGLPYIVMPLLRGETLRQRLQRECRIPPSDAVRIVKEVAAALGTAHKAGFIHRDIKPDNIMLEGDDGRAVVMDFGIAKALGGEAPTLTGTGTVVGTPYYMSPEQASGSQQIDSRADLYSLGVVAYQMLVGQVPFGGDAVQEVLIKHMTVIPEPANAVRAEISAHLSDVVDRCLAKKPQDRWASADELIRSLDDISPAALPKIRGRRRVVAAVTGVVVLAVAAAGIWRLATGRHGPAGPTTGSARQASPAAPTAAPDGAATATALRESGAPAAAPLSLQGVPAGAQVQVDGRRWRGAPGSPIPLTPGTAHRILVAAAGFRTWETTVTPANASPLRRSVPALVADTAGRPPVATAPEAFGFISVGSRPPSVLSVAGQLIGRTPRANVRVRAGAARLLFELTDSTGAWSWDTTVTVVAGDTLRLGFLRLVRRQ